MLHSFCFEKSVFDQMKEDQAAKTVTTVLKNKQRNKKISVSLNSETSWTFKIVFSQWPKELVEQQCSPHSGVAMIGLEVGLAQGLSLSSRAEKRKS